MYCEKCGTELISDNESCTNCGIDKTINDMEIKLQLKPRLPVSDILLVIYTFLFGIFFLIIFVLTNSFIYGIIFTILGIIAFFHYNRPIYHFYNTKIIYKHFFLKKFETEIKYKYIEKISMKQSPIQKFFNIGNITLSTNIVTELGENIFIVNVKKIDKVYNQIKSIIDENNTNIIFCKNCGAQINNAVIFCNECGQSRIRNSMNKKIEIEEDYRTKFELKPKFNLIYKIYKIIIGAVSIVSAFFAFFADIFWLDPNPPTMIIFIILIIALIIALLITIGQFIYLKKEKELYNDSIYKFYTTKVNFEDIDSNEQKEIKYKDIREISMSQSIIERICGIGTIKIFVNAPINYRNTSSEKIMKGRNGIYIDCVKNIQQKYQTIKQIIDKGTP